MKDQIQNIQTGLLVIIASTVIYGTFIQDNGSSRQRERVRNERMETPQSTLAQPTSNLAQPQSNVAQPPVTPPPPVKVENPTRITFPIPTVDFGTIKQDTENETVFTFTNSGDKPLIIESATGSCGCTVPEFPREPIPPGESGEIKVVYKPGKQKGMQNKTITVVANTEPRETRLSITANVEEVK
jgi:hypothetical protein